MTWPQKDPPMSNQTAGQPQNQNTQAPATTAAPAAAAAGEKAKFSWGSAAAGFGAGLTVGAAGGYWLGGRGKVRMDIPR